MPNNEETRKRLKYHIDNFLNSMDIELNYSIIDNKDVTFRVDIYD